MKGPHVATALGTAMLCAFYLALLHMLRHVQAPFDDIGAPHDALNPIALMNSTERKLRDYLSAPPPKSKSAFAAAVTQVPSEALLRGMIVILPEAGDQRWAKTGGGSSCRWV